MAVIVASFPCESLRTTVGGAPYPLPPSRTRISETLDWLRYDAALTTRPDGGDGGESVENVASGGA